jgi:hypothetical protein
MLASAPRQQTAAAVPSQPPAAAPPAVQPVTAAPPPSEPPRAVLTTARGPQPSYRAGESMTLQLQPTQDAFVYCYYQDAGGAVARIFPNRFQPDPFVRASRRVEIPPPGAGAFAIRFDTAGAHEAVSCLATDSELGMKLPDALKTKDLEPLPVRGLDDVAERFRGIAGARVDEARLNIEVTQ